MIRPIVNSLIQAIVGRIAPINFGIIRIESFTFYTANSEVIITSDGNVFAVNNSNT